ncbi:mechanosensitive ion channel family protein [Thiomicrorhabdus aquaedulcis]|uniref:mechanosensitive ion channel family protein n=1 Tax=Thiomicrorhabdus aquaedulcis TaxID=2211106 RepID=UPI000FD864F5|nr:mechanosensitive ion channel family protein [Thiomicrorhabdus aquaedulcis]
MSDNFELNTLQKLFHSDSLLIESLSLFSFALVSAVLFNFFIKWTLLAWAQKHQKPTLSFALDAIRLPITLSILLFTGNAFLQLFSLPNTLETHLPGVFTTLDIIVWGQFFYRTNQFSLQQLSARPKQGAIIRPQTLPLIENASAVLIVLFIVYLLFITWNIDMTAWLASAGIIGIAVGFAAKDTLANLLSGVFILADSPYKIGDYIVLDAGERGMVTHIGLRSTRILTRDDLEINIPNAIIANGKVVNESSGRHLKSRARVAVSVAYGSDIEMVKNVLLDIAYQETQICSEPEARVRFRRFGASGLDLELLVWIDHPEVRGRVIDSLNTRIYQRFALEKIEIPYNKLDLYLKSLPENTPLNASLNVPLDPH